LKRGRKVLRGNQTIKREESSPSRIRREATETHIFANNQGTSNMKEPTEGRGKAYKRTPCQVSPLPGGPCDPVR